MDAQWKHEGIMPKFDEYLENGKWSIGTATTLPLIMMGMKEADKDAFQWLVNYDAKILRAMSVLSRLYNDAVTNEVHIYNYRLVNILSRYSLQYGILHSH